MESAIDQLLAGNEEIETPSDPPPAPPPGQVAIVTCMDWRVQPHRFLGAGANEAHVMRNAGGLVTEDTLRSLALSQSALGTREVMVVMHTLCGVQADERSLREAVATATSTTPTIPFGGFDDLDERVRESLQTVRETAWIPHRDKVRGFVFDVVDGSLREIPG